MDIGLPHADRLVRRLLIAVAVLHVLSLGSNAIYHGLGIHDPFPRFGWFTMFFNVDKEKNLPTWFSSAVLMLAACVLWQIGTEARTAGRRYVRHWRALSLVFAVLSLDEVAQAHEVASRSGVLELGSASYLSWMVFVAPLVLAFAVSYLRFLFHLPVRTRWLIVLAGCVYVGGAMGMEAVGAFLGRDPDTGEMQAGLPYLQYLLAASAEELMEMLGAVLFAYAATDYLQRRLAEAGSGAEAALPVPARPSRPVRTRVGASR
ncbi:hypothetical protein QEZ54_21430 [Catellatospora sp. KI3]|uniref:hypothetical protein n=1 Tax=Catellatospora sp. KI3 TaxID=3041620 RepID=UPI0024830CE6|nr:hypothetical protein [Catellatospora sp. KI3]MDI1463548.1 hypothetical protein [Catellatospora sp. KI3]